MSLLRHGYSRIRTYDHLVKSQMLYRLSYTPLTIQSKESSTHLTFQVLLERSTSVINAVHREARECST